MNIQKFYFVFITTLLFIGVYSFKVGNINNIFAELKSDQATSDVLSEAFMTYNNNNSTYNKKNINSESEQKQSSDFQHIAVNLPTALSGKSKSEIYNIRKKYVKESVFAKANYEPSEEVFGGIVGGKPWISANVCANPQTGLQSINGPSEESRFINNPTMLVAIEYPFIVHYTDSERCASKRVELIPTSIKYSAKKKLIIVKYYHLPFSTNNNPSFYVFNGINARDLGYKYAYIDMNKSSYPVDFIHSDNISAGIKEFQNFIHLGGSCGHDGGCNNGSPRQPFLEFKSNATSYNNENRVIYIKLWKSMPKSPDAPADIIEKIILKWS